MTLKNPQLRHTENQQTPPGGEIQPALRVQRFRSVGSDLSLLQQSRLVICVIDAHRSAPHARALLSVDLQPISSNLNSIISSSKKKKEAYD